MIAGWVIFTLGLAIAVYDLIAFLIGLPTISTELHDWQKKGFLIVYFILAVLAGHLISFGGCF